MSPVIAPPPAAEGRHIVDTLIEERAQALMHRSIVWRLVRTFIYPLLGYRQAVDMADRISGMTGQQVFDYLSARLRLAVDCQGLEHVPALGSAVITANHPAGIADGVAVYDALKRVRPDITFFANRDAIRVAPGLADMVVPVEWMETRRSHCRGRETVRHMVEAFRSQRLIVIFPSGRLAQPTLKGLVERGWQPSAVSLAQRYGSPVIPMHIRARSSWLYYFFYILNQELRDMTLFRELLNKRGHPYQIRVGEPFRPTGDPRELSLQLRAFVAEAMPRGASRFDPTGTDKPA